MRRAIVFFDLICQPQHLGVVTQLWLISFEASVAAAFSGTAAAGFLDGGSAVLSALTLFLSNQAMHRNSDYIFNPEGHIEYESGSKLTSVAEQMS